jgi:hypothetical protein
MIKLLGLASAAYFTMICETVLAPELSFKAPAACWVWLMLPWIAVTVSGARGIALAAFYGLCVDCLADGMLGPSICLSVLSVSVMQRCVSEKSLQSAMSVGLWTFICCSVLSGILSAIQLSAGLIELPIQTVAFRITACSVLACVAVICVTRIRLFPRTASTNA